MTYRYDLISEPWLPCVMPNGRVVELGLRDALVDADKYRELGGESPLVTAALYRLLLAMLHRVFGPADRDSWRGLWAQGRWDAVMLDAYLTTWHQRFDLFAEQSPFCQAKHPTIGFSPVGDLAHEYCRADTLFDHRVGTPELTFTPAQAARHLLAAHTFGRWMTKGPYGQLPFGTCARGIVFLVKGNTLFEDLALNLIRYPTRDDILPHNEADAPCWEMPDAFLPARKRPLGLLDELTWLSRRICLEPEMVDGQLRVRRAKIAPGLRMDDDVPEPMLQYQLERKGGPKCVAYREDRALWRDSAALFRLPEAGQADSAQTRPPACVGWLAALVEEGTPGLEPARAKSLVALGMAGKTQKYQVYFYRRDVLPLPFSVLRYQDSVLHLENGLEEAEQIGEKLTGALCKLANWLLLHKDVERPVRLQKDERDRLVASWAAEGRYWADLEPAFYVLLDGLSADAQAARRTWSSTLHRAGWQALETVIAGLASDPTCLKAGVMARAQLGAELAKVRNSRLGEQSEPQAEEVAHA
jgi:CRISPR system Cascade subunit CasA